VRSLDRALCAAGLGSAFILIVDDGSTDDTARDLEGCRESAAHPQIFVWHLNTHEGKGAALRAGFLFSDHPYVAFLDGDGDIDPASVILAYRLARASGADIVYGSKKHPASVVRYPPLRRSVSALGRGLTRMATQGKCRDSQTGAKVLSRRLEGAVRDCQEKGFAFDLVLLSGLARGTTQMVSCPVTITKSRGGFPARAGFVTLVRMTRCALGRYPGR